MDVRVCRANPAMMEDVMGRSAFARGAKGNKPWNADRWIGPKCALRPQQVWAIRFRLDHPRRVCDRAPFDLALDSKLRGRDLVRMKIGGIFVLEKSGHAVWLFRRKQAGRFSSNCWRWRARASGLGCYVEVGR